MTKYLIVFTDGDFVALTDTKDLKLPYNLKTSEEVLEYYKSKDNITNIIKITSYSDIEISPYDTKSTEREA